MRCKTFATAIGLANTLAQEAEDASMSEAVTAPKDIKAKMVKFLQWANMSRSSGSRAFKTPSGVMSTSFWMNYCPT